MLALFPEGFEEREGDWGLELAAYTDAEGEERLGALGPVSTRTVAEGWEEGWRTFHRPVRVGPLWVGPPWEQPPGGALAVVIDPGRAFGTGAHATTRLCLELMLGIEPRSLLDVGCGSGVLAVAAARLGFSPVVAVDIDEAALEATEQNAAANGVAVAARRADALSDPLPAAEVTVANLTLEAVEAVAPRLRSGVLLTSGYLVAEAPRLAPFRPVARRALDGWAADRSARG